MVDAFSLGIWRDEISAAFIHRTRLTMKEESTSWAFPIIPLSRFNLVYSFRSFFAPFDLWIRQSILNTQNELPWPNLAYCLWHECRPVVLTFWSENSFALSWLGETSRVRAAPGIKESLGLVLSRHKVSPRRSRYVVNFTQKASFWLKPRGGHFRVTRKWPPKDSGWHGPLTDPRWRFRGGSKNHCSAHSPKIHLHCRQAWIHLNHSCSYRLSWRYKSFQASKLKKKLIT